MLCLTQRRVLQSRFVSFVPAKCPSCSAQIQVPDDRERANCMYCGATLLTRTAISLLGGPSQKDILNLAFQLLEARDFKQADDKLNYILEYNPKDSNAWAAKAYISLNPELRDVRTWHELFHRMSSGYEQANVYWRNAFEIPSFDEQLSKLLSRLFAQEGVWEHWQDHPDHTYLKTLLPSEVTDQYWACRGVWQVISTLCLRCAHALDPESDVEFRHIIGERYVSLKTRSIKANAIFPDRKRSEYLEMAIEIVQQVVDEIGKEHPDWKARLEATIRLKAQECQEGLNPPRKKSFWDLF